MPSFRSSSTSEHCHPALNPLIILNSITNNELEPFKMSLSFGSSSNGWVDTSPQGWEKFKNVIRGLYIVKRHKLEGPNGVIKLMESQYGFKAT
jgi:hypothetical protein